MPNKLPAIHPGEVLRDEMEALELSANALARALDVPVNRITMILKGQRSVTADTALRLARYFDTSAQFWLNLQLSCDLKQAETAAGAAIRRKVKPRAA